MQFSTIALPLIAIMAAFAAAAPVAEPAPVADAVDIPEEPYFE
jgi:hypothetical protein